MTPSAVSSFFYLGKRYDWSPEFTKFDSNIRKTLPAVNIQQKFPIINADITCPAIGSVPAFSVGVDVNLDCKTHAQIAIGIAATGTIIPPKLDNLALYTSEQFASNLTLQHDRVSQVSTLTSTVPLISKLMPQSVSDI
jgi:hypothetical protein